MMKKTYFASVLLALIACALMFWATQVYAVKKWNKTLPNPTNNETITFRLERKDNLSSHFYVNGWIVNNNPDVSSNQTSIKVLLKQGDDFYAIPTRLAERKDVVEALNLPNIKKNAGFSAGVLKQLLPSETFQLFLLFTYGNETFLIDTHERFHF